MMKSLTKKNSRSKIKSKYHIQRNEMSNPIYVQQQQQTNMIKLCVECCCVVANVIININM